MVVARGCGEGEMQSCLMGVKFQFHKVNEVVEIGCTTM